MTSTSVHRVSKGAYSTGRARFGVMAGLWPPHSGFSQPDAPAGPGLARPPRPHHSPTPAPRPGPPPRPDQNLPPPERHGGVPPLGPPGATGGASYSDQSARWKHSARRSWAAVRSRGAVGGVGKPSLRAAARP